MILGAGIDIVEISRMERALQRRGARLRRRLFTPRERRACAGRRREASGLALRFAVKEAGMKAVGTGWAKGVRWHDFETLESAEGLRLEVGGRALELLQAEGFDRAWLATSLTRSHALAQVVLEASAERDAGP